MKRRRRTQAFTLVEIMIVLAILVLLVAMVGPRLLKTQEKADTKITQAQIENLEQALNFYKVDNRSFPTTEEGLGALMKKPADENRARNWAGPYLEEDALPVDPWGNQYRYEYPVSRGANLDKPGIWSLGPDGKENTQDDVVNWNATDGKPANSQSEDLAVTN